MTSPAAVNEQEPLLRISGLGVEIQGPGAALPILADVHLTIHDGEVVGMVGESGSGKTMTALAILNLLPENAVACGSIRFRGRELLGMDPRALNRIRGKAIGMVYQEPMSSMNPAYTIGEQIDETIRRHLNLSRRAARSRTLELLHLVGISEPAKRADDYPYMFSGGMLQRAGIAMALSCEPSLLLADEPTTALDATVQAQVLDLLHSLTEKLDMALLLLTHDMGIVASLCDKVVVMYCGEVVESASALDLFKRPRHPYSEGLLGSVVTLETVDELASIPGTVPSPRSIPEGCRFHPRCPYVVRPRCTVQPVAISRDGDRRVRCVRAEELELQGAK